MLEAAGSSRVILRVAYDGPQELEDCTRLEASGSNQQTIFACGHCLAGNLELKVLG